MAKPKFCPGQKEESYPKFGIRRITLDGEQYWFAGQMEKNGTVYPGGTFYRQESAAWDWALDKLSEWQTLNRWFAENVVQNKPLALREPSSPNRTSINFAGRRRGKVGKG